MSNSEAGKEPTSTYLEIQVSLVIAVYSAMFTY